MPPLLLHALPDDALALIAQRVVLHGETYWFAATCHAARNATRAACVALAMSRFVSYPKTMFTSLPRLRAGLRLSTLSNAVLANSTCPGADSLPQSMDCRITWAPLACRALIAGGTLDVLAYAWPCWMSRIMPRDNVNALRLVCRYKRVDLLQAMYLLQPYNQKDQRTLRRTITLAVEGHPPARINLFASMFEAILQYCSYEAAEWLYKTLEELTATRYETWRTWLSDATAVGPLVVAACSGDSPDDALRMLTGWFIPRFASRAPNERAASLQSIIQFVLITLSGARAPRDHRHRIWQWLSEAWPLGLAHLLRHVHENGWRVDGDSISVQRVHRNCLHVTDVGTYRWMSGQMALGTDGWVYTAARCDAEDVPFTTHKDVFNLKQNLQTPAPHDTDVRRAFAFHVFHSCVDAFSKIKLSSVHPRRVHESSIGEARQLWAYSRALAIESFADVLLYTNPQAMCVQTPTRALLEISLHAYAEGFSLFRERCTDSHKIEVVLDQTVQMFRMKLGETKTGDLNLHVGDGTLDDSDDEEQRSSASKHISVLRKDYSKVGE